MATYGSAALSSIPLSAKRLNGEAPMRGWVGRPPTTQELAVLTCLVRGLSNDEIGDELSVSEETVKKQVSSLLRKSGAVNRAELAAKAVKLGIVKLPDEEPSPESPQ
jgi:DNA-binding NarL/FixJ family response regulator